MDEHFPFGQFLKIKPNTDTAQSAVLDNIQRSVKTNFLRPKNKHKTIKEDAISAQENTASDEKKVEDHIKDNSSDEFALIMQKKMGAHAFSAYVENKLKILQKDSQCIQFIVPGPFNKLMLEKHYGQDLQQTIEELFGADFSYEIKIEGQKKATHQQSTSSHSNKKLEVEDIQGKIDSRVIDRLDRLHSTNVIDRNKNLDNFVVGPSNNMAYAVCMTISDRPGGVYHSLYIQSCTGLGKTHLIHGLAGQIQQKRPELRVILTNARDFMSEMMESMAKKAVKDFRSKYSEKVDVLLIDDIHEIRNRPGTQNEIAHIFNEFIQNGKQLVFTSNRPPKEIEGLEDRVLTRLAGGLIVDIQKPELETRMSIIKQKAKEEDLFFPTDVVKLLALAYPHNIGELEGAIVRLAAYSNIMKVDIDLDVAKEQLKLKNDYHSEKMLDIKMITKIVADRYQIPMTDLRSQARHKNLVLPRHIAMYLAQKHLKITLVEIGQFFGNRDHSSVIHGTRKINTLIKQSPSELYFIIQDMEKLILK